MSNQLLWRDRVVIAQHEVTVAALVIADIIDKHAATEVDWQRMTLVLHRLRALAAA